MKIQQILFSEPMVNAILAGKKSQTRRTVKPFGVHSTPGVVPDVSSCPYGGVGSRLWVRETSWIWGSWVKNGLTATGRQKWRFNEDAAQTVRFTAPTTDLVTTKSAGVQGWVKRPSIFMPRWACRIYLEIEQIRVEALQDIREEDAWAEGIDACEALSMGCTTGAAEAAYSALWTRINGEDSWEQNPLVWAITFQRIAMPTRCC